MRSASADTTAFSPGGWRGPLRWCGAAVAHTAARTEAGPRQNDTENHLIRHWGMHPLGDAGPCSTRAGGLLGQVAPEEPRRPSPVGEGLGGGGGVRS